MSVAIPHTSRSAVIRYARSAGDSFIAPPTISGTATAPAYIAEHVLQTEGGELAVRGGTSSTG